MEDIPNLKRLHVYSAITCGLYVYRTLRFSRVVKEREQLFDALTWSAQFWVASQAVGFILLCTMFASLVAMFIFQRMAPFLDNFMFLFADGPLAVLILFLLIAGGLRAQRRANQKKEPVYPFLWPTISRTVRKYFSSPIPPMADVSDRPLFAPVIELFRCAELIIQIDWAVLRTIVGKG